MNRFISACVTLLTTATLFADGIELQYSSVTPATSIVNKKASTESGTYLGKVGHVVIDREFGRLAAVAVRRPATEGQIRTSLMLPAPLLRYEPGAEDIVVAASAESLRSVANGVEGYPTSLSDPAEMGRLYDQFGVSKYWVDREEPDAALALVTADELDGRIIRDTEWRQLARVKDILLAPKDGWAVSYLALGELHDAGSSERIAVPMAAFARKTLSPTWVLDVSSEAKLMKETFRSGEWPTEVSRGWIEFTHVKYGTNAEGGLQDPS